MLLSIIFLVMLFAIMFVVTMQGLFSALLMMVLTLCCATAAFGWYEWVADNLVSNYLNPSYAHAVSLGVLFGVSLLILRLVFDKVIRRSCLLPAMVDRIGGGLCSAITAMVMVGVVATSIQMIPFGESILGFSPFTVSTYQSGQSDPDPIHEQRELWLKPDRFAAGAASMLSSGIFSHKRNFFQDHPDPIQAAGWMNTTHREISRFAKPRSMNMVSSGQVQFMYRLIPGNKKADEPDVYEPISPEGGNVFQMVRVELKQGAQDKNNNHHFTLRQFRLVGQDGVDGPWEQHFPVAIQQEDASQAVNRHIRYKNIRGKDWPVYDELYAPRSDNNSEVEIVFDISKEFVPSFLEYKRSARVNVKFSKEAPKLQSNLQETTATPSDSSSDSSRRSSRGSRRSRSGDTGADASRGGNVRGLSAETGQSFFGDRLPYEMKSYTTRNNAEILRGKLQSGHLIGEVDQQSGGKDRKVAKFAVHRDQRLLQLDTGVLKSGSYLGKALSQAVNVAQNYVVEDADGKQYRFVGKYATARVDGKDVVEIQYFPDQVGSVGGVVAFNRINEKELQSGDRVVLLFLVDPGAEIVSFSTGGAATRKDDLRGENLTAPQ